MRNLVKQTAVATAALALVSGFSLASAPTASASTGAASTVARHNPHGPPVYPPPWSGPPHGPPVYPPPWSVHPPYYHPRCWQVPGYWVWVHHHRVWVPPRWQCSHGR